MATELGSAYVSVWAETSKLETQIKAALDGSGKHADRAGNDIGKRISESASKALKDGWRPDQDIMAGIPDTKLDRIGARIGQVIGKGLVGGLRAKEAGVQFAQSFGDGAGSIGLGRVIGGWRKELSGGALHSMGFLAGKTLSAGLTAGVGLGVAGIGLALTSGFDRLEKLDAAKSKLNNLNKAAALFNKPLIDVKKTVDDVTKSVTGTPYSLDAAFGIAVNAIGSGAKDISSYMAAVTDATAFAGGSIEDIGGVFQDILNQGNVTLESLNRLDARFPATSWVKESVAKTGGDFDKMLKNGEITMDMLQKSIEEHAPGLAKSAGDTLAGSIELMKTAVARTGADFLASLFGGPTGDPAEGLKSAIQRVTEMLNNLDGWIKAHKDQIKNFFNDAKDAAAKVVEVVGKILDAINNIPGGITTVVAAFAAWKAIEGVAALATALKGISTLLAVTLPADAAMGAGLISSALAGIAIPAALIAAGGLLGGASFSSTMDDLGGDNTPAGRNAKNQLFSPGFGIPGAVNAFPATEPPTETDGRRRKPGHSNATDPTGGLLQGTLGGGGSDNGSLIPGMGIPGVGGGGNGYIGNTADPVERWRPMVRQALSQYGPQYGITNMSAWEQKMMTQIRTESAGNPSVFNNYDSNAQAGHPSRGLLQFIPSTFAQHNITGGDIMDPYAQIAAFIPYVSKRYGMDKNGSPLQVGRGVGYASGGGISGPGSGTSDSIPALLSNGEHVLSAKDVSAMGGQGGVYAFRNALHRAMGGGISQGQVPYDPFTPGPGKKPGDQGSPAPDKNPGSGYPGVIGFPQWGTPGTKFGAPPPDWWLNKINPDDVLFPDWMNPEDRGRWMDQWNGSGIQGFASGGAVSDQMLKDMRTAGAIPAAAGSNAKAGTSGIAGAIDMGGEVINGIIDQAASAASTAAGAAVAAGSFGAGAAGGSQGAAMAAQFAIGLGTNAAKRGVTYGFDLLGIGADSILQQLTPFGQPSWLSTNPSGFVPQQAITGALGNLMSGGAQQAADPAGSLLNPKTKEHGTMMGAAPGPIDNLMGTIGPETPSPMVSDASSFLSTQPLAAEAPAPNQAPMFKVDNIYTQDVDSLGRELNKQGRLAQMQYTNRPGP